MAEAGAFGEDLQAPVTELSFWKLSGRSASGEERPIFVKEPEKLRAVIDEAGARLPELFAKFSLPQTPYLAAPHPERSTYEDVYKGISRRGEWGRQGDDDAA